MLCNTSFQSQYAKLNGKQISILDYLKNRSAYQNIKLYCQNSHELIPVNGTQRISHFRHLHREDLENSTMSEWHSEWQGNFLNTEKWFSKKNSDQIRSRRADVVLNDTNTLEFQHSTMPKSEVEDRQHDYKLHNKEIIWIIDGSASITVTKLPHANRIYLEFDPTEEWKFASFISYKYIYIDINTKIFKINPSKVKSYMIDVELPKEKKDFIEALKMGQDLWTNEESNQCNLYIRQQGAGNGKTYGIVNMIQNVEFNHKKNFIYVSKQHSAKYVIYNELVDQINNLHLSKLEKITANEDEEINKKYVIKFLNKDTNNECQIFIATIDSLMYSIGDKNHKEYDKFQGIINSIVDGTIQTDKTGQIKFTDLKPKLNKETLLIIDESQDLTKNYAVAIIQIMRNKYIDAFFVGDKLQSISLADNAFVYLYENDFPSINVVKIKPENICRRFIHPKLIEFVNKMIPYLEYNLPSIYPYKQYIEEDYNPLVFFEGKSIYEKDSSNENKLNCEVDIIMKEFIKEVEENDRLPNDFLIITPFTSNNPLVLALQISVEQYWNEKIGLNNDTYTRHCIFHRSEEGTSIDLNESKDATRIVSIHASKGDGRNVTFIIGLTESALKKFSLTQKNLVYESLFNVAITRQKQKIYFRLENNGDDISQRINQYRFINGCLEIKPNIHIFNNIRLDNLTDKISKAYFSTFNETIILKTDKDKLEENEDEKKVIDMGNHILRYSSLLNSILIEIVNKEMNNDDNLKKQIKALMHLISNAIISHVSSWKEYNIMIDHNDKKSINKIIPILKLSQNGIDYIRYFKIINENMKHIQKKLLKYLETNNLLSFCPLESVIFYFMLGIIRSGRYCNISIVEIYNIINVYKNAFNNNMLGHQECLCNTHFPKNGSEDSNNSITQYLCSHYEKIESIKNVMNVFHTKYSDISWLYDHNIKFEGNANFSLSNQFTLIGYNKTTVIIGYIKPQFNQLNYNEVLMQSLYDTFLVQNIKRLNKEDKESDNYKRFTGKKVITCIFTLDRKEPYYLNWQSNNIDQIKTNSDLFKKHLQYEIIDKYKTDNNAIFYFYQYWRKNASDKIASKFITLLRDKYNEIKENNETNTKSFPIYIDDFLVKLDNKIEDASKKEREKILYYYDDKENFMNELNKRLEISVTKYLNIEDEKEDSDEEA